MTVERAHFCGPKESGDSSNTYQASGAPVDVGAADFTDLDDDGELPFK